MTFFFWMIILFFPGVLWRVFLEKKIQHGADLFSEKKFFPLARLTALQAGHPWTLKYRAKTKNKNECFLV